MTRTGLAVTGAMVATELQPAVCWGRQMRYSDISSASSYIFKPEAVPLSSRARYSEIPEIQRLEAVGSPSHVAFHQIGHAEQASRSYCTAHSHNFAELNLLIGAPGALQYEFRVGDDVFLVDSPASVWIPAGVVHSANLYAGTGTFVVAYVKEPQPKAH